jgi:hypothetical protein
MCSSSNAPRHHCCESSCIRRAWEASLAVQNDDLDLASLPVLEIYDLLHNIALAAFPTAANICIVVALPLDGPVGCSCSLCLVS